MQELLERLKAALNELDVDDFMLIEKADTFYTSAIKQIVDHLEWLVSRKKEPNHNV